MGQFMGGFATASVLAAIGGVVYFGYVSVSDDVTPGTCGDHCGEGTVCIEGRCEIAPPDEALDEPEDANGKKKRKRRRRGGGGGAQAEDTGSFTPVSDKGVPRYNPKAEESITMDSGTERLSDRVVDAELAKLDGAFQKCVTTAAQYADDLGSGTVKIKFGVGQNGKVTGVNASAPVNLSEWGIVPCVRVAVYKHRFPPFDGPTMRVETSFDVR